MSHQWHEVYTRLSLARFVLYIAVMFYVTVTDCLLLFELHDRRWAAFLDYLCELPCCPLFLASFRSKAIDYRCGSDSGCVWGGLGGKVVFPKCYEYLAILTLMEHLAGPWDDKRSVRKTGGADESVRMATLVFWFHLDVSECLLLIKQDLSHPHFHTFAQILYDLYRQIQMHKFD